MAADPNALLASVTCLECAGSPGLFQLYKLALLKQILLAADPTAMTDPNTLMSQISCYACLPAGQLQLIEIALLSSIVDAGGGGSGAVLEYTTTDPTTDGIVPTNVNDPAVAYSRDGTGPTYVWNTVTHVWN